MGAQRENGLTLEALAKRLEALTEKLGGLERENARMRSESEQMRSENAELRHKVSTLEDSGTRRSEVASLGGSEPHLNGEPVSVLEGRVSRRSLLSKAGAAAVAAVAAGTLLDARVAEAHHGGTTYIKADGVSAHYVTARSEEAFAAAVRARNDNLHAAGVEGDSSNGIGVRGDSDFGIGVYGSGKIAGVLGNNFSRAGNDAFGVKGEAPDAIGVRGIGQAGVWGSSSVTGYEGVYGQHTGGNGYGVVGDGTGDSAGVLGRNPSGPGVEGRDSRYGGKFAGSTAQLMLVPGNSAGKPTTGTHTKGEIYMDSAGALFVCTAGDGTTVGTWKKVNMKLV